MLGGGAKRGPAARAGCAREELELRWSRGAPVDVWTGGSMLATVATVIYAGGFVATVISILDAWPRISGIMLRLLLIRGFLYAIRQGRAYSRSL